MERVIDRTAAVVSVLKVGLEEHFPISRAKENADLVWDLLRKRDVELHKHIDEIFDARAKRFQVSVYPWTAPISKVRRMAASTSLFLALSTLLDLSGVTASSLAQMDPSSLPNSTLNGASFALLVSFSKNHFYLCGISVFSWNGRTPSQSCAPMLCSFAERDSLRPVPCRNCCV